MFTCVSIFAREVEVQEKRLRTMHRTCGRVWRYRRFVASCFALHVSHMYPSTFSSLMKEERQSESSHESGPLSLSESLVVGGVEVGGRVASLLSSSVVVSVVLSLSVAFVLLVVLLVVLVVLAVVLSFSVVSSLSVEVLASEAEGESSSFAGAPFCFVLALGFVVVVFFLFLR